MSLIRKFKDRTHRRMLRVRKQLAGDKPRVSVFRSLSHIYAQLIDDAQSLTLASASSLNLKDVKGDKKKIAHEIGKELAHKALEKGVKKIVFDRGTCRYHGRVQALAEGLREGGLEF